MKHIVLLVLTLGMHYPVIGQTFTIDDKGIVKCPNAKVGDKATLLGDTYEAVDRNLLIQRRDQGADLTKVCTSLVTDMSGMFSDRSFNQPIGIWDVGNVTNMALMFTNSPFNQFIGNWDVSRVKSMKFMFAGSRFNQPIGNWDVSKVINMFEMFKNSSFNQPIGNWNVSNVEDMSGMFYGGGDFINLRHNPFNQDISNWNVGKVKNMSYMFYISIFDQPIGNWDVTNVTDMRHMFNESSFNRDINKWNVKNVKNMSYMFSGKTAFNQPIGNWDVSNVDDMRFMFSGNQRGYLNPFNQSLENWNVSNVGDMKALFLDSRFNQSIEKWNVSKVTNMENMFQNSEFNKPINQWCVTYILAEPKDFSTASPLTSQNKPIWGTCPGLPLKTTLSKPSDNSTDTAFKPFFEWNSVKDATKYQIQIIQGFDPVVFDTTISSTTLTLNKSLKSKTLHNWRVRGINESKKLTGEWSSVWKFTTISIPIPALASPTNGSTEVSGPVQLVWTPTSNTVGYHLQVSPSDGFTTLFFENNSVINSLFTLPNFVSGNPAKLYWRVRSKLDSGEFGEWSPVWSFTRAKLTSDDNTTEQPLAFELKPNYPNPFNPTTTINFSIPTTSAVRLEVFSILGQPVTVLVDKMMTRGTHSVSFDAGSLSSGVYLYKLTSGDQSQIRMMNLVK